LHDAARQEENMSHPVVWFEVMGKGFRTFRLDRMGQIEAQDAFDEEPGRGLRDYLRAFGPQAEQLLDD
jgi:predicted DNA-binding transcriptional regulator YafY